MYMEMQSTHNRQSNLPKEGKSGPGFETYKAVVIKHQDRRLDLCIIYGHLISNKGHSLWGKEKHQQMVIEQLNIHMQNGELSILHIRFKLNLK